MSKCPLTGKFCNKEKCYSITEINDGVMENIELCQNCIKDYKTDFALFDDIISELAQIVVSENKRCPKCNCSMQNIFEMARLGCPTCYEFFEKELKPRINYCHGSPIELKHIGKVPKEWKRKNQKEKLTRKLQEAIEIEDYETAATIRDQINETNSLNQRG